MMGQGLLQYPLWNQKKMISVFGHSGFIGTHFCNKYSDEVIKIPREDRVPQSEDILYLISTNTNYNVYKDATLDVKTNLLVLLEVLQNFNPVQHTFNFVSSWFTYGTTKLPATETSPCNPKGFYSITKKAAEDLLISFCRTFGVKYRIFRLANVYGIGDNYSKEKNAFQYLLDKLYNNEEVKLYYGGEFVRDFIHVDDACGAMRHFMYFGEPNEIYNIGNGLPFNFGKLIKFCKEELNSSSKISTMEPTEFHNIVQVKDFWMNTDKLKSTGFVCRKDFHDFMLEYKRSKGK